MHTLNTQLLVIGAGPGGYVCAIRAGQLGIKTIIVEAEKPGGTCLNVGCIPSKALIHAADEFDKLMSYTSASTVAGTMGIRADSPSIDLKATMAWKDSIVSRLNGGVSGLLKKANVQIIYGVARFRDGKTVVVESGDEYADSTINTAFDEPFEGPLQIHCENVVIATGSEAVAVPSLPFGEHILSSTDALSLTSVPKTLAVVGGGYIGLELGTCFAKLGASVSIVEFESRLLPQYDAELTQPVMDRLALLGVNVLTNTKALEHVDGALRISSESGDERLVPADKVLVTVGRQARLSGWGLSELSLTTENDYLSVDKNCQTSMRGVYAIGDVSGEPMLAHRAMAQGEMLAKRIAGQSVEWDKRVIPAVCFTDPELVVAGMTPEDATQAGEDFSVSTFPFRANARAMTVQREDGFIRIVSRNGTHVLLGVQAVGAGVAELSAAFATAIEMGARADDITACVHAHPTLGEAFQEACMNALGHGLHL